MEEAPKKIELYFDGVKHECTLEPDRNGSFLYVAENGRFAKFGNDLEALETLILRHNQNNNKLVEVIPDEVFGEVTTFDKDGNVIRVEQPK